MESKHSERVKGHSKMSDLDGWTPRRRKEIIEEV